jgi:hypothetical protein
MLIKEISLIQLIANLREENDKSNYSMIGKG